MAFVRSSELSTGVIRLEAEKKGPRFLFLVGLHPDEAGNGWESLLTVVRQELSAGSVTLIHCFPDEPLQRLVGPGQQDPNRCFPPPSNVSEDDMLARRLRLIQEHVDACDVFIDFHRYSKGDGSAVSFPFDTEGIQFALEVGLKRVVTELVWMVEGAVALYAHRAGKKTLVVEAGPKDRVEETDHNVVMAAMGVLHIHGCLSSGYVPSFKGEWPACSKVLRCLRAIKASELPKEERERVVQEMHLGPVSSELAQALSLGGDIRLLLANATADPFAFACMPETGTSREG